MKKIITLFMSVVMIFSLAACGSDGGSSTNQPSSSESKNTPVVYFSMPETTDPNNMTKDEDQSVVVIDGKILGNTQYVAQLIQ